MPVRIATPLVVLCAAALLSGCASQEATTRAEERYSAPAMRVGSNIPVGRERDQAPREKSAFEEQFLDELKRPRTTGSGG